MTVADSLGLVDGLGEGSINCRTIPVMLRYSTSSASHPPARGTHDGRARSLSISHSQPDCSNLTINNLLIAVQRECNDSTMGISFAGKKLKYGCILYTNFRA